MSADVPPSARLREADLIVEGGALLSGQVRPQGFKHSLVTTVAALLLSAAPVALENVPSIMEKHALTALLESLCAKISYSDDVLMIDVSSLLTKTLSEEDASLIHGSVYLIPGLLARCGSVVFPNSGGCQIGEGAGTRPTEYFDVLARFGANAIETRRGRELRATGLRACDIDLADYTVDRHLKTGPLYSGATKTAVLAAVLADGTSILRSPYPKADVIELVDVLIDMGAEIERAAGGELVVEGTAGQPLTQPARHTLVPDLIEIVTWGVGRPVCVSKATASGLRLMTSRRSSTSSISLASTTTSEPITLRCTTPSVYIPSSSLFILTASSATASRSYRCSPPEPMVTRM